MERPRSTLGLALHVVRLRWQALTARGRFAASVAFALFAVLGVLGMRMALGGACCASSCAARRAQLEAETAPAAVVVAPAPAATEDGCAFAAQ